jgi:hypothetical protein
MPQPNQVVDVWKFLEEWNRCVSSRYQRDSMYRWGAFDDCSNQSKDLRIAARAKLKSDEKEARELVECTYFKTNLGSDSKNSPTAGYIWELKKKPGWEVETDTATSIP